MITLQGTAHYCVAGLKDYDCDTVIFFFRENLQYHLLYHQEEPVVFCNSVTDWPASKWKPRELVDIFSGQKLKFRIGKKHCNGKMLRIVIAIYSHLSVLTY